MNFRGPLDRSLGRHVYIDTKCYSNEITGTSDHFVSRVWSNRDP